MAQEKTKNIDYFCQNLKSSWEEATILTESIDNIELDNKNKEILSNNFDRTFISQGGAV